jgi:hypothetical protein
MSLLSPEEKELIGAHREMKRRESLDKTRNLSEWEEQKSPEEKVESAKWVASRLREEEASIQKKQDESPWGFKWSWDRGVSTPGKPSEDNPDYDEDGNLIVDPEVVRAYKIPDIHVGAAYDFTEDKIRSLMEVELFELKVPKLRYLPVGITAGEQYLGGHISKKWVSVFEIETGLFFGRDFEEDRNTWGLGGLIIRF